MRDASLSADGTKIYFTSSEAHPGELHYYVMPAQGGPRTRLTSMTGQHAAASPPTGRRWPRSSARRPSRASSTSSRAKPGAEARALTLSTTEEFRSYAWMEPEVLSFKARDGADIYARLFRPASPHPKRPAVIFIHGAGYLQNAHKGWSTYYREYMFHNLLAAAGYHVLDLDYRGSSGYGRDCRTGIYRFMGGKDLDDVVDGAKFLVETCGVDAGRIGCYGGSYGGFLTLMAMFTAPDTFKAGAALRPVTDWAALQRRLHGRHPEPAAEGRRSLQEELAHLSGPGPEGRPPHLPRRRGHQRPRPGQHPAGPAADRAAQGELGAGPLPEREPQLRQRRFLGRRVQEDLQAVRDEPEELIG